MRRHAVYTVLLHLLLCQSGCRKSEDETPLDAGYNYLPLAVGNWIEYQVDSIVYDDFTASVDTTSFFLREECIRTFVDLENRPAFHFEQYQKSSDTGTWEYRSSYYIVSVLTRSERVQDNQRTVMLTYPVKEGRSWDVNAFQPAAPQRAEYASIDQPLSLNDLAFDSVLHLVLLNDTNNFVIKQFSEERYARGIGLVYKSFYYVETQFNIDSGLLWRQTVIDHHLAE